jgi:hypothetical protein
MPHYADGSQAKVGDVVVGTTYNRSGTVIGVVTKIVESESCNATVQAFARKYGDTIVMTDAEDYTEVKNLAKVL